MFKKICIAFLVMGCACAHALTFDLTNTNSDHGDGGYLSNYQWATDSTYGDYWEAITIIGADRSAWMSRTTSWATFISDTTEFSTTFSEAATISFDWVYTTADSDLLADAAGYVLNGVFYSLNSTTSSTSSGHTTVSVEAGDTFGWYVSSTDELGGRATLALTNVTLSSVSAVPEPAPLAGMIGGLAVLGLVARRRRVNT